MSYIKRTTSLLVFFLFIASIIAFAVSTMFYQQSLTKLNDIIIQEKDEALSLSRQLSSLQRNNTELNNFLALQLQKEQNLSGQYSEVKIQSVTLSDENKNLKKQLSDTQAELLGTKTQLMGIQGALDVLTNQTSNMNLTAETYLNDLHDICDQIEGQVNVSRCRKY